MSDDLDGTAQQFDRDLNPLILLSDFQTNSPLSHNGIKRLGVESFPKAVDFQWTSATGQSRPRKILLWSSLGFPIAFKHMETSKPHKKHWALSRLLLCVIKSKWNLHTSQNPILCKFKIQFYVTPNWIETLNTRHKN